MRPAYCLSLARNRTGADTDCEADLGVDVAGLLAANGLCYGLWNVREGHALILSQVRGLGDRGRLVFAFGFVFRFAIRPPSLRSNS